MTHDEFERGLADIAVRRGVARAAASRADRLAAGHYSREDLVDAAPDYIGSLVGDRAADEHPLATHLRRMSSLRRVAYEFHGVDTAQDLHRALALSDWPTLVATRVAQAVTQRPSGLAEHLAICAPVELDSYHPAAFFETAAADDLTPIPMGGGPWPIPEINLSDASVTGAPSRYVARVTVPRALYLTATLSPIEALTQELINVLRRAESKAFSAYLESGPLLGDGAALFVDGTNAVASGAGGPPSSTTLGVALKTLRSQTNAAGAVNGVRGRYVVVPADLQAAALAAVAEADPLDRLGLQVVVLPYAASATTWWVFADPAEVPAIARLTLGEANDIAVEARSIPLQDAFSFSAQVDFGFLALSRAGCFRNYGS